LGATDFTAGAGTLAGNYTLPSSASGPGHITTRPLTATLTANPNTPYGATTDATPTTSKSYQSRLGRGETVTLTQTPGTHNRKDRATGATVTASLSATDFTAGAGTLAGNYTLPSSASGPGHITTRPITATLTANDKTYDGTNTEPDASMS